ncbi:sulfate reduction electron transfer complex DsrMKJOP subunit DsrP [Geoalkalibacter sp.]|uniref:sulfate reduction electron transfer complex DsrMKJOP subunit DsrP n=1 Tax=Geoalkalibacter sp. TaxID=3041440 RepID=UPI00272DFB7E|nr:NrfD/PsrC family molybdoenzyme membrane anchor subunit [Geoalkalibacter sp.]
MRNNLAAELRTFAGGLFQVMFVGGRAFYTWMIFLTLFVAAGLATYVTQVTQGMAITHMRDQVSWGFYISNFTFLVGVAAAAVLLVIPAYLYHFKAIKKIVAFGELLAVTAVIMAILFVFVDIGRPDRIWHMLPGLGILNFPSSILAWDLMVLNGYLLLNLGITTYIGTCTYLGREPDKRIVIPLILLSIPWAVGIHTVTAYLYNGLPARSFWNASILAPRFLASAFCAGPALMIVIFQILRRVMDFQVRDRAIFKLAEIIAYAMAVNLFLMGAEIFKEYYSHTFHLASLEYLLQGLDGKTRLVPWTWAAILFNLIGFFLFLLPKTRRNFITLNIGCVLIFVGIWIEKGMGLIVPGFIPDSLGEIYEYMPSYREVLIGLGIWATGGLIYTLAVRTVIALDTGRLRHPAAPPLIPDYDEEGPLARDVMSANPITVRPDTNIAEARAIMSYSGSGGLPVVDEQNRVVGMLSESDLIFHEIHQEPQLVERFKHLLLPKFRRKNFPGEQVAEIMSSPAITAREDAPVLELSQMLLENNIKRIVIVDALDQPVGIVSRGDIVRTFGTGFGGLQKFVEENDSQLEKN